MACILTGSRRGPAFFGPSSGCWQGSFMTPVHGSRSASANNFTACRRPTGIRSPFVGSACRLPGRCRAGDRADRRGARNTGRSRAGPQTAGRCSRRPVSGGRASGWQRGVPAPVFAGWARHVPPATPPVSSRAPGGIARLARTPASAICSAYRSTSFQATATRENSS